MSFFTSLVLYRIRIHSLGFEQPALGRLVRQFRAGLAHEQTDRGRDAMRVYLPLPILGSSVSKFSVL